MNSNEMYSILTRFGSCYQINLRFPVTDIVSNLENNFSWVRYNPRKKIERYGLSVTSLDGKMSGVPDLDSLYEYYDKTGIRLIERDFNVKTKAYKYFSKWFEPFEGSLGRTHVIKLMPGGFFPWHRDSKYPTISAFRLFLPIKFSDKSSIFLLEDNLLKFDNGIMYFIDTSKMHSLCNISTTDPCYFLVVNVDLTEEAINTVCSKMLG